MSLPRRRPGLPRLVRPPRGARIAAAESNLAALAADYPALAAETLAELRAAWAEIGADPAAPGPHARLFRAAHTLKGEGTSFGYPLASAVAASLCLVLERGHARDPLGRPAVEAHVAALGAILDARLAGGGGELGARLMLALRDRVANGAAALRARPEAPPPAG
jgi:chemotaxis protein histidine kinase CheA